MRVALFITCFNDTLFPQTGRAVVTLLERLGCEVDFPEAQTCCGQMHTNTGYRERGLTLALIEAGSDVQRRDAARAGRALWFLGDVLGRFRNRAYATPAGRAAAICPLELGSCSRPWSTTFSALVDAASANVS